MFVALDIKWVRLRLEIRCSLLKCIIQLIYQLGGFVHFFIDLILHTSCAALCTTSSSKDFTFRVGTSYFLFFSFCGRIEFGGECFLVVLFLVDWG